MKNQLFYGDNLELLRKYVKDESVDLCYFDSYHAPVQKKAQVWDKDIEEKFLEVVASPNNNCTKQAVQWIISFEKQLKKSPELAILVQNVLLLTEVFRTLKKTGSCYIRCKTDLAPYFRLLADSIFTTQKGVFRNEIILRYEKPRNTKLKKYKELVWNKRYFQPLHETLLFYTKSKQYYFEKPRNEDTTCWTMYESQTEKDLSVAGYKSETLLRRILKASSKPNDIVLDLFAKSGSTAIVANDLERNWILIEQNKVFCELIKFRLLENQINYQIN